MKNITVLDLNSRGDVAGVISDAVVTVKVEGDADEKCGATDGAGVCVFADIPDAARITVHVEKEGYFVADYAPKPAIYYRLPMRARPPEPDTVIAPAAPTPPPPPAAPKQTEPLLQFFAYDHLPPALRVISSRFHDLAYQLVRELPRNAERTFALRQLLLAKDAAVRAMLAED